MNPASVSRWHAVVLVFVFSICTSTLAADAPFAVAVGNLNAKSFADKGKAASSLAEVGHPRTTVVLHAMLDGKLYARKRDKRIVIVAKSDSGFNLEDAVSGESMGAAGKRELRKIGVNNKLRRVLRNLLARLRLTHEDPAMRLTAVREMAKHMDASAETLLREALPTESDARVRDVIEASLALIDLGSDDAQLRLAAVRQLRGNLGPEVRAGLEAFISRESIAPDARIAARRVLKGIDEKRAVFEFLETLFFGLSLGSILVLAAIGLAITFGVMGVINMAHGELMMLGAYTTYVVQLLMPNHIDSSLFVAIPAAFVVAALVGIAIERGIIRYLYGRPLETLLATFGVSLILQQTVRSIFSPLNRSVSTPSWMSGYLEVNSALVLTYNRLYIIAFTLVVFAALVLILRRTSLGLQVRAVSQNRAMAKAMGVRTERIDALTFGLGSGIAGVAGVALSQLTNVGPNLGQAYIIDSFMVVVFGGVGNLWGTLVGGVSLGVANKFLEPFAGAVMAKILVLVFIILFIQRRPRGLFPQQGRAADG